MYDGVYEVREYINGGTDWYPHYFDNLYGARTWVGENRGDLDWGAAVFFRRFDPDHEPEEVS